ncbi:hypothetical protein E3P77_00505 [Wallemia ichthyophaga]|nr:hypothetical protein E3P77_00505 [Wallemia ichthyophaga]
MEIQTNRLKSYNRAYHINTLHLDIEELSKAGFYAMDSKSDNVHCAYCELQLRDWKPDDNPHRLHIDFAPQCPYAKVVCGVHVDALIWGDIDAGRDRRNYYEDEPLQNGRVPRSRPMIDARKQTFVKCVRPLVVSVHKLSLAGFSYAPTTEAFDCCQCVLCDLSLSDWQKGDDPNEEHKNRSPQCSFFDAKSVKGTCPQPKITDTKIDTTGVELEPAAKGGRKTKGKSTSRSASLATDNDESEMKLPKRGTRTRSQSRQPEEFQQLAQPRQPPSRRTTSRTVSQQKKLSTKPTQLEDVVESPKKPLPPTPKEDKKTDPTTKLSPFPELSNSNGVRSSRNALNQMNKSPSRLKEVVNKETEETDEISADNSGQNNDRTLTLAEYIRKCVTDEANKMRQTGETQINKFESNAKRGEDELRAKLSQARL